MTDDEAVEGERPREAQIAYLRDLPRWADLEVMASEEMWR